MNYLKYRKDTFTTTGNDGLIEKIFNTINIKQGTFIEFGAWDGIKRANCRKLFLEGWDGLFIESNFLRYLKLFWNYRNQKKIQTLYAKVDCEGKQSLDYLVEKAGIEKVDFISIDVDGLDFAIFEKIEKLSPILFCIEGGQMLEPYHPKLPREIEKKNIQQSLNILKIIAEKKGYKILCSFQDTFLIRKDYTHFFEINDNIERLYIDGLISSYNRLPWIQRVLKLVNLKNEIIDTILHQTKYKQYGYEKRKIWAEENSDDIIKTIKKII